MRTPYGSMAAPGAAAAALVQYVVLRGDLARPPLSWPLGAVVAQACHAALAAVHTHRQHPDTGAYLEQGGAMRTVVLEVRGACRERRAQGGGGGHFGRERRSPEGRGGLSGTAVQAEKINENPPYFEGFSNPCWLTALPALAEAGGAARIQRLLNKM